MSAIQTLEAAFLVDEAEKDLEALTSRALFLAGVFDPEDVTVENGGFFVISRDSACLVAHTVPPDPYVAVQKVTIRYASSSQSNVVLLAQKRAMKNN